MVAQPEHPKIRKQISPKLMRENMVLLQNHFLQLIPTVLCPIYIQGAILRFLSLAGGPCTMKISNSQKNNYIDQILSTKIIKYKNFPSSETIQHKPGLIQQSVNIHYGTGKTGKVRFYRKQYSSKTRY